MLTCKPAKKTIEMNHMLGIFPHQIPTCKDCYQQLVRRLIFLVHTRPDIAYVLSVVSQFMHSPSEEHMNGVYQILQYLKNALGKGLLFFKMVLPTLKAIQILIVQVIKQFGYFTFAKSILVTWRSKRLWHDQVQELNFEVWPMVCVNCCGLRVF
jgi:hypothetical protein